MCVLYVSFGSKVRPRTLGALPWVVLCCLLLGPDCAYILQGSGVNRVQVVLSGFNKRLFCFVQAKTLCRYGCMYFLAALVLVCVGCDCDVICIGHDPEPVHWVVVSLRCKC